MSQSNSTQKDGCLHRELNILQVMSPCLHSIQYTAITLRFLRQQQSCFCVGIIILCFYQCTFQGPVRRLSPDRSRHYFKYKMASRERFRHPDDGISLAAKLLATFSHTAHFQTPELLSRKVAPLRPCVDCNVHMGCHVSDLLPRHKYTRPLQYSTPVQ